MNNLFTEEMIQNIVIEHPHLLGHLCGKDKMIDLHSEWIKYCFDSKDHRTSLQAFRGGYKTTAVTTIGVIRALLLNPEERIAIIRKGYLDACTVVNAIKLIMEKPEVKALFENCVGMIPKAVTARDGKLQYNFKTKVSPEASVTAHGIDSSLTGMHYTTIILDDVITLKDRISHAEREKTKEVIMEIAANIADPGARVINVGTPWHPDDAWNTIGTFSEIKKYPLSQYSFLSAEDVEDKRKATSPYLFAANYELELRKDDDLLFSDPQFTKGWDFTQRDVYAHIDAAYGGEDYCAMTIGSPIDAYNFKPDCNIQIAGFTYKGNIKDWLNTIVKYCKVYHIRYIWMEDNGDKGFLAERLEALGIRTKTYTERMNKEIKISTYLYQWWKQIYFTTDCDDDYMSLICDWKIDGDNHDDSPDSLASFLRQVCGNRNKKSKSLYAW